jgi:hypothetical protein
MSAEALALSLLAVLAVGVMVMRGWRSAKSFAQLRGARLVTCPETKETVAVKVNAKRAALQSFVGVSHLRLSDCTRWPERQNCGQDCLSQVEADPDGCLVWNIVAHWYEGRNCVYCGKPFGHINWHDHRPALLSPDKKTVQWTEVPPEKLPEYFATYKPVCWDCHVAESFRREHPDLVTDRLQH